MSSIEEIVAKKSERLGLAIKSKSYNKLELCFNPSKQLEIIIDELYNFLKVINDTNNELAIRLWKVENENVSELIYHIPQTASKLLTNSELFQIDTEFKKVIAKRRSAIIENSKTDKSFKKIRECKDCNGCNIITIPIIDDKTSIIYSILQIRYKYTYNTRAVYISKKKIEHLVVFDKFLRRLQFEHRVALIYKEKKYV
ncbi:MAG: hypothetical protein ACYDEX_26400 [Mobilitalea sp.]